MIAYVVQVVTGLQNKLSPNDSRGTCTVYARRAAPESDRGRAVPSVFCKMRSYFHNARRFLASLKVSQGVVRLRSESLGLVWVHVVRRLDVTSFVPSRFHGERTSGIRR